MATQLNVPYHSQWADDANLKNADCGPTCLTMLFNYREVPMTPDKVYDFIVYADTPLAQRFKSTGITDFSQLAGAARQNQMELKYKQYDTHDEAFRNLKANLDAGTPGIALVRYAPWKAALGNNFDGGHFVVVTGYDDDHIYIHDPLFGNSVKPAERGAHVAMPNALFDAGWSTTFDPDPEVSIGLNRSILYNGQVVTDGAAPVPQPQPQPQPQPVPTPNPIQPPQQISQPGARTMNDVERRIRALAAWRWAEPPDFTNPEATKIWLDNLGDFGLEYDEYRVQNGDSLSALAVKHYGQQNRWPAIKSYNDMKREFLNLGELIFIPRVGTSGAQSNSALPHDTLDTPKGLDDLLFDPDREPFDYNAEISPLSAGMGFAG